MTDTPPAHLTDWTGKAWTPDCGRVAAHANARFTVAATRCPSLDAKWDDPNGVPIAAFLFGGRRSDTAPLVVQSFDWADGVYKAATLGSETTAAIAGAVGVVRRDPFAMIAFCGYNMGDYFQHWLNVGAKLAHPPAIFQVNWFRKDEGGKFVWPGFGENMRVLQWVVERAAGGGKATTTPLGYVPAYSDLNWNGSDFTAAQYATVTGIDSAQWQRELGLHDELFTKLAASLPKELAASRAELGKRLAA